MWTCLGCCAAVCSLSGKPVNVDFDKSDTAAGTRWFSTLQVPLIKHILKWRIPELVYWIYIQNSASYSYMHSYYISSLMCITPDSNTVAGPST